MAKHRRFSNRNTEDSDGNNAGDKKRKSPTESDAQRKNSKNPHRSTPCNVNDNPNEEQRNTDNTEDKPTSASPTATSKHPIASSSASSSASEPLDPYEFAVRPEEDNTEYPNSRPQSTGHGNMRRMKVAKTERTEERSTSESARSSPISHSSNTQTSNIDTRTSPLTVQCTRPLTIVTDFPNASSPANRLTKNETNCTLNLPTCHLQPRLSTSVSFPHGLNVETTRSSVIVSDSCPFHPLPSFENMPQTQNNDAAEVTSFSDQAIQNGESQTTRFANPPNMIQPGNTIAENGKRDSEHVSTTSTANSKSGVGVNTTLTQTRSTMVEPDLLGPCEPGTTICLNGIVWLETSTGVLVVNVTWRGRTYIGSLLDATQHDFAPPCPRTYTPAVKSSNLRTSNRSKRRLASSYRNQANITSFSAQSDNQGTSIPRNRFRTRIVPIRGDDTTTTSTTTHDQTSGHSERKRRRSSSPQNADGPATQVNLSDRNESTSHNASDEDTVSNHKEPNAGNGSDGNEETADANTVSSESSNINAAKISIRNESNTEELVNVSSSSLSQLTVDEELDTTFPITCVVDGCSKRFTNMTALRFHLTHAKHRRAEPSTSTNDSKASTSEVQANNTEPPRTCSASPSTNSDKSHKFPTTSDSIYVHLPTENQIQNTTNCNQLIEAAVLQTSSNDHGDSHRLHPKDFRATSANDSLSSSISVRTVTAHTVSIPCGVPDTAEGNGYPIIRPTLAHASTNKQRPTGSISRVDATKPRLNQMKASNSSHRGDSNHFVSPSRNIDNNNARHVVNPLGIRTDICNPFGNFRNPAATTPVPNPNSTLLSLGAGLWDFVNPNHNNPVPHPPMQSRITQENSRQTSNGIHLPHSFPTHVRASQPTCNFATLSSPASIEANSASGTSSAGNYPSFNHVAEPNLHLLPEFLMAAALSAISNSNGVANSADRGAYPPNSSLNNPSPRQPPQPNHLISNMNNTFQPLRPPIPSAHSGSGFTLPSFGSLLNGAIATSASQDPPNAGANQSNPSNRNDPFKLSAAYLMHQAANGSNLSSVFGQH